MRTITQMMNHLPTESPPGKKTHRHLSPVVMSRPRQASSRQRLMLIAVTLFVLAISIIVSNSTRFDNVNQFVPLTLLGFLCLMPLGLAFARRKVDIFEPIYALALSTVIYFVLIPSVMLLQRDFTFVGVDYSRYLNSVTILASLAFLGFGIGYYLQQPGRSTPDSNIPSVTMDEQTRRYLWRWSMFLFVFFLVLVLLWIIIARIPLRSLWVFGEASYNDAARLATGPEIGYLYGAREALPACLLLLLAFRSQRKWPVGALLALLGLTLFFAGLGARFRVLLLLLGVAIYFFLEKKRRPKLWQTAVAGFLIFYLVIGGVGFYRSDVAESGSLRGRAVGQDTLTLVDAWDVMLGSSQISVSTALLVSVVPDYEPYFGGTSFLNFFTQPIPRILWPEKPVTVGQDFFSSLWQPGTTIPFWAIFYLNFGPWAIVPGMAIWGWLSGKIYSAQRRKPWDPFLQIQLAAYWPFLIHMYGRGGDNFAFNVYALIYVLTPVWVMMWLARRRYQSDAKTHLDGAVNQRVTQGAKI